MVVKFPPHQQVGVASYYLTNQLDLCRTTNSTNYIKEGFNWEKLKKLLRAEFYADFLRKEKERSPSTYPRAWRF